MKMIVAIVLCVFMSSISCRHINKDEPAMNVAAYSLEESDDPLKKLADNLSCYNVEKLKQLMEEYGKLKGGVHAKSLEKAHGLYRAKFALAISMCTIFENGKKDKEIQQLLQNSVLSILNNPDNPDDPDDPKGLLKSTNAEVRMIAEQARKNAFTEYFRPAIDPLFAKYQKTLEQVCNLQKKYPVKASMQVAPPELIKGTLDIPFIQSFMSKTLDEFRDVKNSINYIKWNIAEVTADAAAWGTSKFPELEKKTDCAKLTEDIFTILHPYCISIKNDSNECSAINVSLVDELYPLGEKIDITIFQLINKLIGDDSIYQDDIIESTNKYIDKYDFWKIVNDEVNTQFSTKTDSEKNWITLLVFTAFGNDNGAPYFFTLYEQRSLAENADRFKKYFKRDFSSLDFMDAIQKAGRMMYKLGFIFSGELMQGNSTSGGVHHYIAGIYTGAQFAKRGYSKNQAEWAGFTPGFLYELKDLIGHVDDVTRVDANNGIWFDSGLKSYNDGSIPKKLAASKTTFKFKGSEFLKQIDTEWKKNNLTNDEYKALNNPNIYNNQNIYELLDNYRDRLLEKNLKPDSMAHLKGAKWAHFWCLNNECSKLSI